MLPYRTHLKDIGRRLRSDMTESEEKLWSRLHRKQILDIQFYRQKPILGFIVDFYAPKAKLVIEVDGSQHYEEQGRLTDQERDGALGSLGLKVLRFDNLQVLRELDSVMNVIWEEVKARI